METEISPQAVRILEVATAHIAAGGYNGFSYADISAEVGISKASIHHHFPRKSDLVRVLLQRYRATADQGLAALTARIANPLDRLQAYTAWWVTCIGDGSKPICICATLGAEIPSLPDEITKEVRLHFASLVNWIEGAMLAGQAGEFLHLRSAPSSEAHAFMAAVHGAMLSARACGNPAVFERIVDALMAHLATPC
jgi:TetR/AcrR family transcriptional repressor of nem operon